MVGAWADKRRRPRARAAGRQPHPGQRIKYLLLIGLLTMAAVELARPLVACWPAAAGSRPLRSFWPVWPCHRWGGSDVMGRVGWMTMAVAGGIGWSWGDRCRDTA
jgi:hypothetical protein